MPGNKLQQLVNANQQQGEHNTTLDARKPANGVYVLQIRAGGANGGAESCSDELSH